MRNLFAKLGASSRADALVRAQRLGWIALPDVSE
jgi:DNA-binding CsgD family transcriptional regulator